MKSSLYFVGLIRRLNTLFNGVNIMFGRWGGKVFAIGGWTKSDQPAYTFKTSELNFHFLSDEPGYRPAPYLAARGMKWIQQYEGEGLEDDELLYYLKESHRIVSLGLTKKKQKELGLNQK